jgi:hypothetical protein
MTYWIDIPLATWVMDFIEFNNFLYIFLFNYMIKIYAHKIKHQLKNRHLFKIIIPKKQTKINNTVHFLSNPILNKKGIN